jgi:hypothetical protein
MFYYKFVYIELYFTGRKEMKWEENDNTFIESFFDGLETVWEYVSPYVYFLLGLVVLFVGVTFSMLLVGICISIWIKILGG